MFVSSFKGHTTTHITKISMDPLEQFEITKSYLLDRLPKELSSPKLLIICGSGLGGLADLLTDNVSFDYADIPGFKASHVPGHKGALVFGHLGSKSTPVMCMVGRFHYYEGHSFFSNTLPVRIAKLLGVTHLIVTNAAGGLNSLYKPGDIMVIDDHINFPGLAGQHPLRGLNLDSFGPRFLPLSDTYDFDLRLKFFKIIKELGITRNVYEGTYCYVSGPTFETRAECRMLQTIGADAVGMSTVPEVIIARHSGIKVLGLSLITNAAVFTKPPSAKQALINGLDSIVDQTDGMASHAEVLENANNAANDLKRLVEHFVSNLE